jgi:acetyl-CoA/propionyl-CoA carboxylase biotin carboxyl carrier protein
VWLTADGQVARCGSYEGRQRGDRRCRGRRRHRAKPGTVTVVQGRGRDQVEAGTPLLVVEAMKMEHVLTAPVAGTVAELGVTAGQSVRLDERVALVTPAAPADEQEK